MTPSPEVRRQALRVAGEAVLVELEGGQLVEADIMVSLDRRKVRQAGVRAARPSAVTLMAGAAAERVAGYRSDDVSDYRRALHHLRKHRGSAGSRDVFAASDVAESVLRRWWPSVEGVAELLTSQLGQSLPLLSVDGQAVRTVMAVRGRADKVRRELAVW